MLKQPPHYRSYLLRIWSERRQDSSKPVAWRYSLEETRSGDRCGFDDLAELVAFLESLTGAGGTSGKKPGLSQPS
jgi:hypothetical protein